MPDNAADMIQAPPAKAATRVRPGFAGGRLQQLPEKDVDYEPLTGSQLFTETTNLAPMVSGMKGARVFIVSKFASQALPMEAPESPLVDSLDETTGGDWSTTMGKTIGVKSSPVKGVVQSVGDKHVHILGNDGESHAVELHHYFPHARKTYSHDTPVVKPGDAVEPGQMVAHNNYVDDTGRWGMGKNLRVAFVAGPHGTTFEDSLAFSASGAKKLASSHMYGFDQELKRGVESDKAKYVSLFPNKYTNDQLDKFGPDGRPKVGAVLNPGDPVLLAYAPRKLRDEDAALGNLHKAMRNSYTDQSQTWDHPAAGTVVDSLAHRRGLSVNVISNVHLREGDKTSSRFGAKGVARVIPDEQMFHDTEGKPMDVLVNPAAMIGRVNPGMIFESQLAKIAQKTGKPYVLPHFPLESYRDFVEQELKKHNLSDREDLIDPVTGRVVPKVMTGIQFFQKLEHMADDKESGRGDEGGVDAYDQPTKGGHEGAKRIGALQTSALLSHNALEVLRDASLYRGSANTEMWNRIRRGLPLPAPKIPFVFNRFLGTLRGAGINVKRTPEGYNIMAMSDKDVDNLARHEVESADTLDLKTGEPIPGGLFDYSKFGGPGGDQFAKISLHEPIPNPLMEDPIRSLLGLTKDKYMQVLSGQETIGGKTGPSAIHKALLGLNLDHMEQDAKSAVTSGRKSLRNSAVKQLGFIDGLRKSKMNADDLMISKVPVVPPSHRPISVINGVATVSDPNYLYRDVLHSRDALRQNAKELPDDALAEERTAVYNSVKALQGLGDPIHRETQEKGVKGFMRVIAGSSGPKCYDDKTEVLTKQGWVPFPEYKDASVEIATLNPDTGEMEYQSPSYILHEQYEGPMVYTKSPRKLDLLVTEGHWHYIETCIKRIVRGTTKRSREWQKPIKAQAGTLADRTQRVRYITAAEGFRGRTPNYTVKGVQVDPQAFSELIGWYLSEGYISDGYVHLCPKEGTTDCSRIDNMLSRLGIRSSRYVTTQKVETKFKKVGYQTTTWMFAQKDLTEWIERNCGTGSDKKKISEEILSWSQDHQLSLLQAYLDGDGEKRITKQGKKRTYQNMSDFISRSSRFTTTSPDLVLGLERLCLQCGLGFKRVDELHENHEVWKKQYRCRIHGWNRVMVEYPEQTKRIKGWKGMVHCVTVPNGLIFVRRNRNVCVSGNTGVFLGKIISHPVNAVGRSVVAPDSNLNMDQIGLPEEMSWKMFGPFTMGRMVRDGMDPAEASRQIKDRTPMAHKYLAQEMDYRPVMYSRDPALHRFNIMGAHAHMRAGSSINASPLVVKPFNLDFDGDQMNVHVPVTPEAIHEVKTKMMPSQNLLGIKNKKVHYQPSQEFILGLYNSSAANPDKKQAFFKTRADAVKAYREGRIDVDTPVVIEQS